MEQFLALVELAKTMPPGVSAVLSLVACCIVWFGGKRILEKFEPIIKELGEQSKTLQLIQLHTAETNGRVLAVERGLKTHESLDEERHTATTDALKHNRNGIHDIRNTLSQIGIEAKLKARRTAEES